MFYFALQFFFHVPVDTRFSTDTDDIEFLHYKRKL